MKLKKIDVLKDESLPFSGERFAFADNVPVEMVCEHLHRYMFAALYAQGRTVLDIASGEGYGSHILSQVADDVTGVDISAEAVDFANTKYGSGNLRFKTGECVAIPCDDNSFDMVVSFETIEHIVEGESFVAEVKRVLRPGGLFLCSSPNKNEYSKDNPAPNEYHLGEMTREEFQTLLAKFFDNTKVLGQSFFLGSVMKSLEAMPSGGEIYFSDAGDGTIVSKERKTDAVYSVVLASDAQLPDVVQSAYKGDYPRTLLSALQGGIAERDAAFTAEVSRLEKELDDRHAAFVAEQNRLEAELVSRDNVVVSEQARLEKELEERHEAFVAEQARLENELKARDAALVAEQARLEAELAERDDISVAERARLENELKARDAALVAEQARLEKELDERHAAFVAEQTRLEGELEARHVAFVTERSRLEAELAEKDAAYVAALARLEETVAERDAELEKLKAESSNLDVAYATIQQQMAQEHETFAAETERLAQELGEREAILASERASASEQVEALQVKLHAATKERDRFKLFFEQQVEYSESVKKSVSFLRHKLSTMAGDIIHVRKSLRWKIGTAIIRFLDAFQLKFKSPSRLDRMDRTVREYRAWETEFDQCQLRADGIDACDTQCFELWDRPVVSIIIPVYNQYDYTRNCITSIVKSGIKVPYEIIVGDDLSSDDTVLLDRQFPFVKVVRNEVNLGFLKNCNNAAQHAQGDYLLFLNNDTQVMFDWLESLYRTMEGSPGVAIAGSKLVYPDGTLQEAGGILWKDGSAWNYGRGCDPNASQYNYVKEADYISGASIMVRRTFWDEVGGFDERYAPAYCEDSDLAFEARRLGYKVVYQPKSVVVHYEGKSHGTDETSGLKAYQVANGKKFYEKWRDVLEREHLPNGQDPIAARDKSIGKRRVLYVDHYVPHFDQDAGSKTALHYLRLLRESDVAVTFLGDNFARHEPYTEALQQLGIEVLYGVEWYENWEQWFSDNAHLFTHVFLNRPHIALKYVDAIRQHSDCKILYYGHDLHFLREQRKAEESGAAINTREIGKVKEMELAICSKVDVCYYPSEVEVEVLQKELPDATIKPVPAYIYDHPALPGLPVAERKGILFVGGFGHPPNIQAVESFLENVFPAISESGEDIPFFIVGSKAPEWLTTLDVPNVHVKGFVSDEELIALYGSCRLVVAPLKYGAGVKGKVVEALYHGVPVVTTTVGAEGLCATEALVVEDDDGQYAKAVVALHGDADRIEHLSNEARQFVEKHFTSNSALRILGDDFDIPNVC